MNQKIFQVDNLHYHFRITYSKNKLYNLSFSDSKKDVAHFSMIDAYSSIKNLSPPLVTALAAHITTVKIDLAMAIVVCMPLLDPKTKMFFLIAPAVVTIMSNTAEFTKRMSAASTDIVSTLSTALHSSTNSEMSNTSTRRLESCLANVAWNFRAESNTVQNAEPWAFPFQKKILFLYQIILLKSIYQMF